MVYKKNETKKIKENMEPQKKLNTQMEVKSYKEFKQDLPLMNQHRTADTN